MVLLHRVLNLSRSSVRKFSSQNELLSPFMRIMQDRGYLHQCTSVDRLDSSLLQQPCVAYLGFDATASSLHVGSLVQIMILRHFQQCGHKPIILMGGGTTMVGDPSGKSEERPLITRDTIERNASSIKKVFSKYLKFGDGPNDAVMVNNADWLCNINYMDFLSHYGRHFSINRMLTFDSVKQRLEREQPLSFLEFNYMLLQAYDFLHLHRSHACLLQFGGADQWGNIVSGVDLVRRVCRQEVYGLTTPLLTTSDGRKMGKSAAGAVWLDAELLCPYDFWQFWRNTSDDDVTRFMKLFTDMPLEEIHEISKSTSGEQWNQAKEKLADAATSMLHGSACLSDIHAQARAIFAQHSISDVPIDALEQHTIKLHSNREERVISDLLVASSMCESKNKARTHIRSGAVRVNGVVVDNEYEKINCEVNIVVKLSLGKKRHVALNFSAD